MSWETRKTPDDTPNSRKPFADTTAKSCDHKQDKRAAPPRSEMPKKILSILLVPILFGAAGFACWYMVRDDIDHRPEYKLLADQITIPPPPPWVPENFVETVLQNSGLTDSGSLLDSNVKQRLFQAFGVYPWVESVQSVELRFPSGADVRLVYRTPVAMVLVGSQGFFPVDRNGVLLPTDYFINVAPESRLNYLRIVNIRSMPFGAAGEPWNDPMVHEATKLAETLADVAAELNLEEIQPLSKTASTDHRIVFHLQTRKKTKIVWGPVEADADVEDAKKQRLRKWAEQYGSLDDIPQNLCPIDLGRPCGG